MLTYRSFHTRRLLGVLVVLVLCGVAGDVANSATAHHVVDQRSNGALGSKVLRLQQYTVRMA